MTFRVGAAAVACCLFTFSISSGAIVTYQDFDGGVGPGQPTPNSDLAAAAFDADAGAIGTINLIDFETGPSGSFTSPRPIAAGVVAHPLGLSSGSGIVSITGDNIVGFNTTVGGSRYLRVNPGGSNSGIRLQFTEPIHAFGAYVTGLGTANGDLTAQFTDGSWVILPIVGQEDGGAQFYGFTNEGVAISSLFIRFQGAAGDVFGLDDIRYVAVPEPASWLLATLGILGLVVVRARQGKC